MIQRLILLACLAAGASAQDLSITAGFPTQQHLPANTPLALVLNRPVAAEEGRVAVFIDRSDVTALFAVLPDRLVYNGERYPLPAGDHELVVYLVSPAGNWSEIARVPFRALSRRGFTTAIITPSADLAGKGQLAERHRPDENAPQRESFQDGTMQLTIRSEHARPDFSIKSEGQVTGVTLRNEALRFSQEGEHAPLLDLSSYRVDLQRGSTVVSVGHLGYGSLRHLVNGFSSRGIALKLGEGKPVSFQLAVLNGSSITGWDNFVGLGNGQHRVIGATAGIELIRSRPGALRVETTLFSGSLLPLSGFNQGSVQTAEKSRGGGLRLQALLLGDRITVDAGFTGSRFTEARDAQVEDGLAVTPIPSRFRRAEYVDASFALLRNRTLGRRKTVTSLSLNAHQERVEPLFRSVGASVQADLSTASVDLTWNLGPFTSTLAHTRLEDNVGGVETILTTKTDRDALTFGAPLASVFGVTGRTASILPTLAVQVEQTHQRAAGLPRDSDFTQADLPDQLSTNALASLAWQAGPLQLAYRFGKTLQDNRQVGRERADFDTLTNAVSIGLSPVPRVSISVELSRDDSTSVEEDKRDRSDRVGTTLSWSLFGQTTLSGNLSQTLGSNSLETSSQRGTDGFVELASGFKLSRGASQKRRGRIFLRYADQRSRRSDSVFGTQSDTQGSTLTSGLTFTPF